MICQKLHRKLNIGQHKPHKWKTWMNAIAIEGLAVAAPLVNLAKNINHHFSYIKTFNLRFQAAIYNSGGFITDIYLMRLQIFMHLMFCFCIISDVLILYLACPLLGATLMNLVLDSRRVHWPFNSPKHIWSTYIRNNNKQNCQWVKSQ